MKRKQGEMWSAFEEADLFLVTTNAFVRRDGALVMGRGIALETTRRYPQFPFKAGGWLRQSGLENSKYGILLPYANETGAIKKLGCFQVKYHFRDNADLELIQYSCELLSEVIQQDGYQNVHLNFPGIGWGHLSYDAVLPIVESLPDQVTLWTK